jgi:hypothetical protein
MTKEKETHNLVSDEAFLDENDLNDDTSKINIDKAYITFNGTIKVLHRSNIEVKNTLLNGWYVDNLCIEFPLKYGDPIILSGKRHISLISSFFIFSFWLFRLSKDVLNTVLPEFRKNLIRIPFTNIYLSPTQALMTNRLKDFSRLLINYPIEIYISEKYANDIMEVVRIKSKKN